MQRERESKLEVSTGSLPLRNLMKEGEERSQDSEGMEDTKRTWTTESTKQGSNLHTETEAASTESAWICTRSSVYLL